MFSTIHLQAFLVLVHTTRSPIWVFLRGSMRKHTHLQKKNTKETRKNNNNNKNLYWTGGRIHTSAKSRPHTVCTERPWLLPLPDHQETLSDVLASGYLFPTRDGVDGIRQNMPKVVPVLLTQEPHALSCQMMKTFCLLPSLGASHSGKDYMDANASRLPGMWVNWLRTEPSWSDKLLHFEYKESLLVLSCSLGFTGMQFSPLWIWIYLPPCEGKFYSSVSDMNLFNPLRTYP